MSSSGSAKPSLVILGEVTASISLRKSKNLCAREYFAFHKPDDRNVVINRSDGKPQPLADTSTQYSFLYLAKWTLKNGLEMVLDEPISAHDAGLGLNCPRFDRDVPEFFVVPKKEDDSWVNIITQIERAVIQVTSL